MLVSDFDYELPKELIAQDPLEDRAASRLMALDRDTGAVFHHTFRDIVDFLNPGDCMVINDTKVIPARLYGNRVGHTGKIEVLLLNRRDHDIWETLVRPGKKLPFGTELEFGGGLLTGKVVEVEEDGNRLIQFFYEGIFEEILDKLGQMPLPPYITHELSDPNRYQTVYATEEGSAAAPTAGLHFTEELLAEIEQKGVRIVRITLHVGLGTFRPVKEEEVTDHKMHSEYYSISQKSAQTINETRKAGGRVIAVGTTSCRTLETAANEDGTIEAKSGWTDIFIYPGYRFKIMDGLITNFHLPQSTLIMLVAAFAGKDHVMAAYEEAVRQKYRFYSFGDAMFITSGIEEREKVKEKENKNPAAGE